MIVDNHTYAAKAESKHSPPWRRIFIPFTKKGLGKVVADKIVVQKYILKYTRMKA